MDDEKEIIDILLKEVGEDFLQSISGKVENPGKREECYIEQFLHNTEIGSVYGFVIELLDDNEKDTFITSLDKQKSIIPLESGKEKYKEEKFSINRDNLGKWEPIKKGSHLYPLYWGRGKWLGYRVVEHVKSHTKVGSIWLFGIEALENRTIYFGTLACDKCKIHEDNLHRNLPDILKTFSRQKDDDMSI